MVSSMDTTTDPFQLLIDAMLSAHSPEGRDLLESSLKVFANEIAADPGVLTRFVTVAADMVDVPLEVFGGMSDPGDRIEFVQECRTNWGAQSAMFNEIESIFKDHEND